MACVWWDFTIHAATYDGKLPEPDDLMKELRELNPKRVVFQYERGEETKREHIQGRIQLRYKTRRPQIKGHYSPTSNNARGQWNYVTKDHTRIRGPFDSATLPTDCDNPRWQAALDNPLPWQTQLKELLEGVNDRQIVMVFDQYGNCGKSTWCNAMDNSKQAILIDDWNDGKDVMAEAFDNAVHKQYKPLFLVDNPRSRLNPRERSILMRKIEIIKNGRLKEHRFKSQKKIVIDPKVVVFSNETPQMWINHQSRDRWIFRTINPLTHELDRQPGF